MRNALWILTLLSAACGPEVGQSRFVGSFQGNELTTVLDTKARTNRTTQYTVEPLDSSSIKAHSQHCTVIADLDNSGIADVRSSSCATWSQDSDGCQRILEQHTSGTVVVGESGRLSISLFGTLQEKCPGQAQPPGRRAEQHFSSY